MLPVWLPWIRKRFLLTPETEKQLLSISPRHARGVTNIVLDHERAAALALEHFQALGHCRIAFIKGQAFSSDTELRWNAIRRTAARLGLPSDPRLTVSSRETAPPPSWATP